MFQLRISLMVLTVLFLCGCTGKTESDVARKTGEPVQKKPDSDVKITFYVKGMSDRLKLT